MFLDVPLTQDPISYLMKLEVNVGLPRLQVYWQYTQQLIWKYLCKNVSPSRKANLPIAIKVPQLKRSIPALQVGACKTPRRIPVTVRCIPSPGEKASITMPICWMHTKQDTLLGSKDSSKVFCCFFNSLKIPRLHLFQRFPKDVGKKPVW